MNKQKSKKIIGVSTPLGTNVIYYRNPVLVAWWSAAFPGFGHILLGQYIKGGLLFIWEIFVNIHSHLNLGLIYTLQGDFERTKAVLDPLWILMYIPLFLFTIWDSYHEAVNLNRYIPLINPTKGKIKQKRINAIGRNFLTEKNPFMALFWSMFFPGTGQFYLHRLFESVLLSFWFIVISHYSRFHQGLLYLIMGDIDRSNQSFQADWFMFLPSLFCFSAFNAFTDAVESTFLYRNTELAELELDYQNPHFKVNFPSQS